MTITVKRCQELYRKDDDDNFKQAQFKMTDADAQVLSGKNSNMTIKYKKRVKYDARKNCHITELKTIFSRKAKRWIFL